MFARFHFNVVLSLILNFLKVNWKVLSEDEAVDSREMKEMCLRKVSTSTFSSNYLVNFKKKRVIQLL